MWYVLILSCFHLIWNYHAYWTWHSCWPRLLFNVIQFGVVYDLLFFGCCDLFQSFSLTTYLCKKVQLYVFGHTRTKDIEYKVNGVRYNRNCWIILVLSHDDMWERIQWQGSPYFLAKGDIPNLYYQNLNIILVMKFCFLFLFILTFCYGTEIMRHGGNTKGSLISI